ncbi:MAG: hypothetical protein N4A71_06245 [Carboxylicivirga sp.]|jgi:hypothetical protein|nr:hypothetical protein [Carboxylicivirga sp.]
MKRIVFATCFLLTMSLAFMSCGKDDDPVNPKGGKYKLEMDGQTIAEGHSNEVGFVQGNGWLASMGNGEDISILLSSVPVKNGQTINIDGSDITVSIMGKLAKGNYLSVGGTITRVSSTKFSFEARCKDLLDWVDGPIYVFTGSIESEAFKIVK